MALNAHQERNLRELVNRRTNELQHAVFEAIGDIERAEKEQARKDWWAANPGLADLQKRMTRYGKTVQKKHDGFLAEAQALGLEVRSSTGYNPEYVFHGLQERALDDTYGKLRETNYRRQGDAREAIRTLQNSLHEQILLASLGETPDILSTIPTVAEILAAL